MSITYSIAIDYNDNGNFTDLSDNISTDILKAEWHLGLAEPYTHVSDISSARITVRNKTGLFSPEITQNLMSKRLRIQSDDGTKIRTHFIGSIKEVRPQTGTHGTNISEIIVLGREYDLTQHRVRLLHQTNFRADTTINMILNQIDWRYDILEGMCIIGRDSIGSSMIFPDESLPKMLETGKSTFSYLADDWADGLDAKDAIEEIAHAEGGRFFFDRNSIATFHNRHHTLLNNDIVATFSDDMSALHYDYGNVINEIEVLLTPRTTSSSSSKIWTLINPLKIRAKSKIRIITRYEFGDESVGAVDIEPLEADVHFKANKTTDPSSDSLTRRLKVDVLQASLSASVIDIENRGTIDAYVTQLDLYGKPQTISNPLTYTSEDISSITLYGRHKHQMTIASITDIEEAIGLADWELTRRSQPQGRVRDLQTNTRNHPTETLALTLFDLINIEESQTGHSADYAIIAEHHQVDMGGTRHQVRWLLEPADSELFFIIGTHSIGNLDVVLAPR
ncbi:MAG: hypothetical protein Phog2KO_27930 [Phototrophicaceae bacterium]